MLASTTHQSILHFISSHEEHRKADVIYDSSLSKLMIVNWWLEDSEWDLQHLQPLLKQPLTAAVSPIIKTERQIYSSQ